MPRANFICHPHLLNSFMLVCLCIYSLLFDSGVFFIWFAVCIGEAFLLLFYFTSLLREICHCLLCMSFSPLNSLSMLSLMLVLQRAKGKGNVILMYNKLIPRHMIFSSS